MEHNFSELARKYNVHRNTLHNWAKKGILEEKCAQLDKNIVHNAQPVSETNVHKSPRELNDKKHQQLIDKINKMFGEGTMRKGSEIPKIKRVKTTPELDEITGGGFPLGRIMEFFGLQGTGKTTLALQLIPFFQNYGRVAFLDVEFALNVEWVESLGVDFSDVYHTQPGFVEDIVTTCEEMILSGEYSLIIIDSVASMIPKPEEEAQPGDSIMGKKAFLLHQMMRKLVPKCAKNDTSLLFLNHERKELGMFPRIHTPGGTAIDYASSLRLRLKKIKDEVEISVNKSKIGGTKKPIKLKLI